MLYIALLHYPVKNKEGRVVTTAIANMDIHDIARAAKTYAVKYFYIVNLNIVVCFYIHYSLFAYLLFNTFVVYNSLMCHTKRSIL